MLVRLHVRACLSSVSSPSTGLASKSNSIAMADDDVALVDVSVAPEPWEHDIVSMFILGVPLKIIQVLVLVVTATNLAHEATERVE